MTPTKKIEQMLAASNVKGLGRALGDRNVVISRRAAQALGELRDSSGIPALAKAVQKSTDEFVKQYSIEALRLIGDDAAVEALMGALFSMDRRAASLAQQALLSIGLADATAAVAVKEALTKNDWQALNAVGHAALRPLNALLNSDLYGSWPSGKRTEVLNYAVRIGATPPARYRRELAQAGIFVSGIHSIADLLMGLRNRNATIRMAAAETLGKARKGWTVRPLYRRFKKETGKGGDRGVAVAIARSMAQLGDLRAINDFQQQLVSSDGRLAAEAARALADIGLKETIEALFWFVASPPPPPAYRNVPVVLSALEAAGTSVVEHLRELITHEKATVRRLMIDIVSRSRHQDSAALFSEMARDRDKDVRRAALDALAHLNTQEAADALFGLADLIERDWVMRALAVITHAAGPKRLRELAPETTVVYGVLTDNHTPVAKARIQFMQEQLSEKTTEHVWYPISAKAETDASGAFTMAVFGFESERILQMRVTMIGKTNTVMAHTADLSLSRGHVHQLKANLDRFFSRLMVEVEVIEIAENSDPI